MSKFKSSHPEHQAYEDAVEIQPLIDAGVAASYIGAAFQIPGNVRAVLAHAFVGTPLTAVGDTIDVYVQTRFALGHPGGVVAVTPVWIDVVHFTQITGVALATVNMFNKIVADLDEAFFENGTALAADGARNIIGDQWRCRWDVVGATADFVLSCAIQPMG